MTRQALVALVAGCGVEDPGPNEGGAVLADRVLAAPGSDGEGFHDSQRAVNGVRGAGAERGSLDVYSLGEAPGTRDHLILGWSGGVVVDGPGPDLVVFENPFEIAGSGARFMDPSIVEVSPDGTEWVAFPHDFLPTDGVWSGDPADWVGFAGTTPVWLHEEDNPVDPLDGSVAGGDPFDLAELPVDDPVAREIMDRGVFAVRLSSAPLWIDPDVDLPYPSEPSSDGADVDGVYARAVIPDE